MPDRCKRHKPPKDDPAAAFEANRDRMKRIAYRMLGSFAEAEDVVQDAYLRWHGSDRFDIREPAAFLTRIVTRLALDRLKSARARRERYTGTWLPEPMVDPREETGLDDDLSLALMLALERLSPLERAAFLLHDVFGMDFPEVASTLNRDEAACRQLASRARRNVRAERPRYPVSGAEGERIAGAFFEASRTGDHQALAGLLAADVVLYADGGGVRPSALVPLVGLKLVAGFFGSIAGMVGGFKPPREFRMIDGLPGFLTLESDGLPQVTAIEIEQGQIKAIYIIRNPEKLRHLAEGAPE